MYSKLIQNIEDHLASNRPWSATLPQIQKVYGVSTDIELAEVAVRISQQLNCVAYLCFTLPESEYLEVKFDIHGICFPSISDMTLYVVPAGLLWDTTGEHYRRSISNRIVEGREYHCIYVCYRDDEGIRESWPYVRSVELHFVR